MAAPEERPRRISRRALLGLLGALGLGAGLAARGLLEPAGRVPEAAEGWIAGPPIQPQPPFDQRGDRLSRVAVGYLPGATGYNVTPPFDPAESYPEYPYAERVAGLPNQGYGLLREALRGWEPAGFGSAQWNPLAGLIRPGDTVALKPNLVWEPGWGEERLGLTTTHPSTLRAAIDYVHKACGPRGRILVMEGTATADQWPAVVRIAHIQELVDHLRRDHQVPVELLNLNDTPREQALLVSLGAHSMLAPLAGRTLFDLHDRPDWHTQSFGVGSYFVAPQPLQADVVVSLAKLKVHRSTGVTLAMKNLFGLIPSWDGPYGDNRLKDVPHYSDREAAGGPRSLYLENDTTWRVAVDLNRILLYADRKGSLREERQRRYLGIVDGLIAAGRDMFNPEPVPLGVLVVGEEPVSVDAVATRSMGFDPRRVRLLAWAQGTARPVLGPAEPSALEVRVSGAASISAAVDGSRVVTPEMQAYPWKGHLEASDFAPPEILQAGIVGRELRVALRDPSGVAFARLMWEREGQPFCSDLRLVGGSPQQGEWRGSLPAEALIGAPMELVSGDALFNSSRHTLR
ncbi:MAG: DUF362 domain-containing protein [Chloroflexota bacterium]